MIHHMHRVLRGIWCWLQLLNRHRAPFGGFSLLGIACFALFYPVLYEASAAGSCWYVADEQNAVLEQGEGGRRP